MNLSISNIAWNSSQNDAVYALMKKYGFTGLEIAPTKIIADEPYSHIAEAAAWAADLREKYGFCVPSMQSIWYGRTEKLFGTEAERTVLFEYTKSAIDFAAAIGCKNLVFGCPKNRNMPNGADFAACAEIAAQFFRALGKYAASKNTCVSLEANPAIYGTNFANTTAEAISIVKKVGSGGFKLNFDVGTIIQNGEDISVLKENVSLINHVHISEPFLKKIEKRDLHKELFDFLRKENYALFVSVEMGLQENISDIEDAMKYVKEVQK